MATPASKQFAVCIYHKNCLDGFASLLIAYMGKVLAEGNSIWFHSESADGNNAPHVNKSKDVLILDVNMKYSYVKGILDNAASVHMIDHHSNSDHNALLGLARENPRFTYMWDDKECAASLTWKWLFGSKPMPRSLNFIKDNDMGVWEIEDTQKFILGLEIKYNTQKGLSREATYEKLNKWKRLFDENQKREERIDKLIRLGKKVYPYQQLVMERMEINTEIVEILNGNTRQPMKVCINNACVFYSRKLAVRLAKKYRDQVSCAIVYYWHASTKKLQCVVRSDKEPILWLIKLHGGGGHPLAGSFYSSASTIYQWMAAHDEMVRRGSPVGA